MLGVTIPRTSVCQHHASPFEAFAHAYFARARLAVWKASRGFGGKTFMLAALALTELLTLNAEVSLLGGSGEQSRRVLSYLSGQGGDQQFTEAAYFPEEKLEGPPTKRRIQTITGGVIRALKASQQSVRGPHPQRLRLDEVDEMKQTILDAALGQPMSSNNIEAQTVLSSTHQNPDGTMTEAMKRARRQGYPIFEWCFQETKKPHGWLDPEEIEDKRRAVPEAMWKREFVGQEPEPTDRLIDTEAIEKTFNPELGTDAGDPQSPIYLHDPIVNGTFYHGTDWGKSEDWTIIHTLMDDPGDDVLVLAAWERMGRVPWPAMIESFEQQIRRYSGPSFHDATGLQQMLDDSMEVESEPWDFSRKKQTWEILSSYIKAIESGELRYPRIEFMYQEHKYLTYEQVYGSDHLPDSVAAGALAYHAYRSDQLPSPQIEVAIV